ncbi:hypothetical protein [Novosphingobium sp. BL-52-GroH]|uniref:hypothetical protein n=1 Tax=Novosphingobium sp. BL-52-GroH TaxID=3349877 RepID=UPI00384DAB73
MLNQHKKMTGRAVPYGVLLTRTSPIIRTRTMAHIQGGLLDAGVPVFDTQLNEREAFRAVFSFKQTLEDLDPREVSNLDKAQAVARRARRGRCASYQFQRGSGMMSRANPFGDLDDFAPQGQPKPVPAAAIEEIARASGFPSRKAHGKPISAEAVEAAPSPSPPPRRRRRTTGRNQQINIKATEGTIAELYPVADDLDLPLGAVLEQTLKALVTAKS